MDEPASRVSVAIRSASERAAARDVAARLGESGKCLRKEPQRRSLPEIPVYGVENTPVFHRDQRKIRGNSVSARLSVYLGLKKFINIQYYCIKRHKYAQIHAFIHNFCINGR